MLQSFLFVFKLPGIFIFLSLPFPMEDLVPILMKFLNKYNCFSSYSLFSNCNIPLDLHPITFKFLGHIENKNASPRHENMLNCYFLFRDIFLFKYLRGTPFRKMDPTQSIASNFKL